MDERVESLCVALKMMMMSLRAVGDTRDRAFRPRYHSFIDDQRSATEISRLVDFLILSGVLLSSRVKADECI